MIRFVADDSMGFKGFALTYSAVDPLETDFDNSEIIDEEESAEVSPTGIPGYFAGGSLKYPKKEDDYDEPEEVYNKKPDPEEGKEDDLDEDLVTDNEDNYIYNSNRINKENVKILENSKKKESIDDDEDEDDRD